MRELNGTVFIYYASAITKQSLQQIIEKKFTIHFLITDFFRDLSTNVLYFLTVTLKKYSHH